MKFLKLLAFCIVFLALGITLVNVADLQKTNTNLNNQLQQQEQTYSGKIDELTVYQEKLVERISLLEENYTKLQTAYDELKAAYDQYIQDSTLEREQLQTTVTSLNATIVELEQNSDVDAETITALRTEVTALETSLENQTTTANQLQATVTQQEATIAELNATIDALIEELNSDLSSGIYKGIFDGSTTEIKGDLFADVVYIRPYAFYSNEFLVSIELPDVTAIGCHAFHLCDMLTTVIAPKCMMIESFAFSGCTLLNSFTFDSVDTIDPDAFHGTGFRSIILREITNIAPTAFASCSNLVSVAFLGNKPINISARVFNDCHNLIGIYTYDLNLFNFPDTFDSNSSFITNIAREAAIVTASSAVPSKFPSFWNYLGDSSGVYAGVALNHTYEEFLEALERYIGGLI